MEESVVARVNYFDRQFLRTQDFVDDQAYYLAMQRRHRIAEHVWGIVAGLEIAPPDKDQKVIVQPGVAVDGYGRELVLREGLTVPPDRFDELGTDVLECWLVYDRTEAEAASGGHAICGSDTLSPYRSEESGRVELLTPNRLVVPDPQDALLPRRQSLDVLDEDRNFDPTRTSPDDLAGHRWTVYLGRIQRSRAKPPIYTVSLAGRPYAGLVGEAIIHPAHRGAVSMPANPSGTTAPGANQGTTNTLSLPAIGLGGQPAGADHYFEVSLYNADLGHRERRLSLDTGGNWEIRGDAEVGGDVIVDGGAVEFRAGPAYNSSMPWRVYHVTRMETPTGNIGQNSAGRYAGGTAQTDVGQAVVDELRIELPPETDDSGPNAQLVIGKWSDDKKQFVPCLTVANDCTVTVYGNLVVQGQICGDVEKQALVSADVTEDGKQRVQTALLAGATNALNAQRVSQFPAQVIGGTSAADLGDRWADFLSELPNTPVYKEVKEVAKRLEELLAKLGLVPRPEPQPLAVSEVQPAAAQSNAEPPTVSGVDQPASEAVVPKSSRSQSRKPKKSAVDSQPSASEGEGQPAGGEAPVNSG
jgi:hypothetical protein